MTGFKIYAVRVTPAAKADLRAVHLRLRRYGSDADADSFLDELLDRAKSLREFPNRGSITSEMEALGHTEFRQILFGRYRIIYTVEDSEVAILMIVDGRRDMAKLLRDRLVRGEPPA